MFALSIVEEEESRAPLNRLLTPQTILIFYVFIILLFIEKIQFDDHVSYQSKSISKLPHGKKKT